MESYQQSSKTKVVAAIIALVVIAGVILLADHLKSATKTTAGSSTAATATTPSSTGTNSTSTSSGSATSSTTASGKTYTASSTYQVPHGSESISVKLTVDNGTVTDASIQNSENDHDSARYQEDFAAVYKQYVVGKKVADLQLGVIAGASDTVEGFNQAVSQIASQVS